MHIFSSQFAIKESLSTNIITIDTETIFLGNLAAGAYGYATFTIDIPSGYKTTGMICIIKGHLSGAGAALTIMANVVRGVTGTISDYYTYFSPVAASSAYTVFKIRIECIKV